MVSGPIPFARAFAALDSTGISRVRSELEDTVAQYRAEDGALVFSMACRLFWGRKLSAAGPLAELTGRSRT